MVKKHKLLSETKQLYKKCRKKSYLQTAHYMIKTSIIIKSSQIYYKSRKDEDDGDYASASPQKYQLPYLIRYIRSKNESVST